MCTLLSCTLVKPLNETLIVLVLTRLYSLICCRVSLTLLERPVLELYLFLPGAKSLVFSIILTAAVLHFTFLCSLSIYHHLISSLIVVGTLIGIIL